MRAESLRVNWNDVFTPTSQSEKKSSPAGPSESRKRVTFDAAVSRGVGRNVALSVATSLQTSGDEAFVVPNRIASPALASKSNVNGRQPFHCRKNRARSC